MQEREKEKKKSVERERKLVGYCQIVGLTLFQIFTKVSLNNVIRKLKTSKMSSLNSVFKYPKMRNITQTLQEKDMFIAKNIKLNFFF